jgi:hypothetical protein
MRLCSQNDKLFGRVYYKFLFFPCFGLASWRKRKCFCTKFKQVALGIFCFSKCDVWVIEQELMFLQHFFREDWSWIDLTLRNVLALRWFWQENLVQNQTRSVLARFLKNLFNIGTKILAIYWSPIDVIWGN